MKKITYKKTIDLIMYKDAYYVRVRDIADLLEIKQPFKFYTYLKTKGEVLTEKKTEPFRDKNIDTGRTIFMKLTELLLILKENEERISKIAHNYNAGVKAIEKVFEGKEFEL